MPELKRKKRGLFASFLANTFNAPSAVIQSVWVVLSSIALFRITGKRKAVGSTHISD